MAPRVQLKHLQTGNVSDHFSVDAAEILASGEYEQVGGPAVRYSLKPKPAPEPGPPVIAPEAPAPAPEQKPLTKPHMVHKGFGKWDVLRGDDSVANEEPLKKADAEALLATL